MENIILFSFSFICWIFWLVGRLVAKGGWLGPGRSQIRWNDDSVWFRWSPAVPLCPTDSYIQRAHNHLTFAQPPQYETLARAELLELLSVLQTLQLSKWKRKRKKTLFLPGTITINWPFPFTPTVRNRCAQNGTTFFSLLQNVVKWGRRTNKHFLWASQAFQSNANEEGRTRNRGHLVSIHHTTCTTFGEKGQK